MSKLGLDQWIVKKRKGLKKECENMEYEEAYWRKANQIHKWFVDNVQNGVDDCDYYEVTKEQIKELLDICNEIYTKSKMVKGKIQNGWAYKDGKREIIWEDGEYIENPEIAESLLPTTTGFFFGSSNYDEYYMHDIKYTIKTFTKILEEFDFENYELFYTSSW